MEWVPRDSAHDGVVFEQDHKMVHKAEQGQNYITAQVSIKLQDSPFSSIENIVAESTMNRQQWVSGWRFAGTRS
jgi:hypothetical protein